MLQSYLRLWEEQQYLPSHPRERRPTYQAEKLTEDCWLDRTAGEKEGSHAEYLCRIGEARDRGEDSPGLGRPDRHEVSHLRHREKASAAWLHFILTAPSGSSRW